MVYTDNGLRLASALAIDGAGPWESPTANVIDLGAIDLDGTTVLSEQDAGIGNQMVVQVYPSGTAAGLSHVTPEVILGSNTALDNEVTVAKLGAIPVADWNDKEKHPFILRISPNPELDDMDPADGLRYMGVRFTKTGSNASGGATVTADLVLNEQPPRRFYPTKYKIL